jgi:teichoic acid transport system permease protein
MRFVLQIIRDIVKNYHLIYRLATYDIKNKYQMHYLGILWQILNPAIQIGIYWTIFGLGIRGGRPVDGVPFFIYLIVGLIPWNFISPGIIQGSNSIYSRVNMVSKMNFPVSILPTITIFSNLFGFLIMLAMLGLGLIVYGINPGIYLLQLPYYILAMIVFIFSVTMLTSTISIIIRDFQLMLQPIMRMMLYFLPILWDTSNLPQVIQTIFKLNPIYYLIEGFRKTFLKHEWFFADLTYTIYFWSVTLLVLLIGAVVHNKFKHKFIDFL